MYKGGSFVFAAAGLYSVVASENDSGLSLGTAGAGTAGASATIVFVAALSNVVRSLLCVCVDRIVNVRVGLGDRQRL